MKKYIILISVITLINNNLQALFEDWTFPPKNASADWKTIHNAPRSGGTDLFYYMPTKQDSYKKEIYNKLFLGNAPLAKCPELAQKYVRNSNNTFGQALDLNTFVSRFQELGNCWDYANDYLPWS